MITKHNSMQSYIVEDKRGISPQETAWLPGPCYLYCYLAIIDLTLAQNSVDMFTMYN